MTDHYDEQPVHLQNSPLVLVVCQIRFDDNLAVIAPQMQFEFYRALGGKSGRYPKILGAVGQLLNVQMSLAGAQVTPVEKKGWRYHASDGHWAVTLLPDSISLETTSYDTWVDFRGRMAEILEAVASTIAPVSTSRLGLRYVNQIVNEHVVAPQDWQQAINPTLLGPLLEPALWPPVVASQEQFELDIADDDRCTVRHGFQGNSPVQPLTTYLLDIDAYRNDVAPFSVLDLLRLADKFNGVVWDLFKRALTSACFYRLKGEGNA